MLFFYQSPNLNGSGGSDRSITPPLRGEENVGEDDAQLRSRHPPAGDRRASPGDGKSRRPGRTGPIWDPPLPGKSFKKNPW